LQPEDLLKVAVRTYTLESNPSKSNEKNYLPVISNHNVSCAMPLISVICWASSRLLKFTGCDSCALLAHPVNSAQALKTAINFNNSFIKTWRGHQTKANIEYPTD
jgi:hypothetical protein